MSLNEELMKAKGETRVFKDIKTKDGKYKKISSSQIGQQMLFEEALRVLDQVKIWINSGSGRSYRKGLQNYFLKDDEDEFLLSKLSQTYLFLAGSVFHHDMTNSKSSRQHRVLTLQKYIMPDLEFDLAWRFLEVAIEVSQYFGVEKVLTGKPGTYNWIFKYTSTINDEILCKLTNDAMQAFYPMPMEEPPLDWKFEDGHLSGGYKTYQYEMIRANRNIDYSRYGKKIFDSINYIQSIPWRVNKYVLEQLNADLKIPRKEDFVKSIYPDPEGCQFDIDLKAKDCPLIESEKQKIKTIRASFSEKLQLYNAEVGDFESAMGKYRAVKIAVEIAERYKGKTLYFPHSFDFRGRIYPICIGLSPQGSDAVKALLEYERGEVLNERGEAWAWSYLTSLYGEDKLPFDERVAMGKELLNADYTEADEPYQFLAHQIELNKFLADPNYEFKGRIHLDACNSGSQFTSAITGDKDGCIATNVIPTINPDGTHTRQDAYILVAHKALELTNEMINTEEDTETREVLEFLKGLLEDKGRKICKRPVMVSNYGGTMGGRTDILWNMFRELGVERKWITRKNAALFSRIIGDSISGVLNGGKAFETYIHKMNDLIAKGNRAIWWTTHDGFHVVHVKNKELKAKRVSCLLPGARKPTTLIKKQYSDKVSSVKMKSAISPNYIHALDAELLRKTALRMKKAGIKDSDWIHDSFGCLPNHVDLMLDITKSEFSKLARRMPLRILDKELRSQVVETKPNRKALAEIKAPNLKGFNAKAGDLDVVFESNWFFS